MSRKVKKQISSASYSLTKFYKKITTTKPSSLALSVMAIAVAVFLFGGGLYNIIMKPYPAVYYGGRFYFLYPELGSQFIFDSLVSMILYGLGIVGLIIMYQSTKYAYKPRQAYMMFLIGVALILIAYVYLEVTIQLKITSR
ncbi:MAG: hypothetical protein ACP5IM_02125 [Candidatus Bathyarchaeia archaeon]|nr:MAG: hypothetical protein C0195_00605 [Candidatus Bathyarchaeota archaeon]